MAERTGTIHDIGYRGYDGPREGSAALATQLFVTGLRHAFGLGRSGKSKILPFVLLAMCTVPAAILVGVVTITGLSELPVSYASYVNQVQSLIALFAAAQAPVLFSRDLRHRSIVLYLARPLSPSTFALVRWLSLTTALIVFIAGPVLVLYAGALLAGLEVGTQTRALGKALVLVVVLAATLAGLTGLISSYSLRRGFAIVGSVVMLVVVGTLVTIVQAVAQEEGLPEVGLAAGLFSPGSLYYGLADAWDAGVEMFTEPTGAWVVAYAAVSLLVVTGSVLLLVRRFTKAGAR
ncbi:ABC transporter permease [Nocardioides piscis]|uniref:ABC transporter permease n=1 Tax=Nocardioides piscis TaxID=2714938 RepID=A0A6G7YBV1_9ACTN|nr:ABC transporter permease [Nocardioides piscis]QIK74273.1 ABC transporter permease [Nocardioides piscis]